VIIVRPTWGAIQWDGTVGGMRECVERFVKAGVPLTGKLVIGPVSYNGPQASVQVLTEITEERDA
jgi:hypothetical protein